MVPIWCVRHYDALSFMRWRRITSVYSRSISFACAISGARRRRPWHNGPGYSHRHGRVLHRDATAFYVDNGKNLPFGGALRVLVLACRDRSPIGALCLSPPWYWALIAPQGFARNSDVSMTAILGRAIGLGILFKGRMTSCHRQALVGLEHVSQFPWPARSACLRSQMRGVTDFRLAPWLGGVSCAARQASLNNHDNSCKKISIREKMTEGLDNQQH